MASWSTRCETLPTESPSGSGPTECARTVYVKLKLPDFRLVSRQVSRTSPTDDVETIFRAARSALEKSHVESRAVRLIGVGLSGLEHPDSDSLQQLNLGFD